MEIKNNQQQFKEIFANPDAADDAIVARFTDQYPYVNPFWFIRARLALIRQDKNTDSYIQKAVLFSPNPEQLTRYLYQAIPIADPDTANSEKIEIDEAHKQMPKDDYIEDIYLEEEEKPIADTHHAKPSRYNDDLMPYTFLWWLQKTRSDYAETYQPYAKPNHQTWTENSSEKRDLLEQQIRENIFHLQSPEQKLSTPFKGETIPFKVPKKENPIIERFIREEPQIKPPSPEKINLENKARQSAEDQSGFVSETLAMIYAEQGFYHKALETYKKLSLKFPKKSPYFAERIKELSNKIN